jgi:uncharacterized membrane protein/glutaredoxin
MMEVTLYTRAGCHLCHETQQLLEDLQPRYPHRLVLIDIDSNEALQRQYGLEIPVVELGPFVLKAPISAQELENALQAASAQHKPASAAQERAGAKGEWSRSNRFTYWFARHYLAVVNTILAIYVGLPFLAAILMNAGATTPAAWIYKVYGTTCHQWAHRSFFLFGEQAVYPRAAAGLSGLLTLNEATGLSEDNSDAALIAAREFIGGVAVGYKVALCERDVAIYGSILLFGLLYGATRRRIPPLPWYLWILFGLLPVAIDGVSQLVSQLPVALLPFRESTPFLRVLTGSMFGFFTAWFGLPLLDQAMQDTQEMLEYKYRRIGAVEITPAGEEV